MKWKCVPFNKMPEEMTDEDMKDGDFDGTEEELKSYLETIYGEGNANYFLE